MEVQKTLEQRVEALEALTKDLLGALLAVNMRCDQSDSQISEPLKRKNQALGKSLLERTFEVAARDVPSVVILPKREEVS